MWCHACAQVLMCPEKSHPAENKDKALLAYTAGVDAWAAGILAYELLVGHPPFERESRADTFEQILYRRPPCPAWLPEGPRAFIAAALTKVQAPIFPPAGLCLIYLHPNKYLDDW